jgi:hypothetical protein
MKDPENKELIRQMKEVLQTYEEPYMEGAWEQFSEEQKTNTMPYWRWMAVAALFLLIGSIWLFSFRQTSDRIQVQIAKKKTLVIPLVKQPLESKIRAADQLAQSRKPVIDSKSKLFLSQSGLRSSSSMDGQIISENDIKNAKILPIGQPQSVELKIAKEVPIVPQRDKFMNFLVDQKKIAEQGKMAESTAKLKSASRWGFGLEILPTVSEAALNVGAGLTTQYKLSEHFSVGSGISFVELQAGKSLTPGVSLFSTKQLQSVDANIRGIDIPLNIVYNINKNFYTAVGVSYFNVLKEDRKNTFVSERQISAFSSDPVTGIAANIRTFVSETTQEADTETMLNGKSYLGFFNFSIGRKQELFKKYNIFIEPFVKVPVGKLSEQELKMLNGGVKFRLAF